MPGQIDLELVFDKLTPAEKHFFAFCCHFMSVLKKLPGNFWMQKVKSIEEIDEEHLRIFSAFLTDMVLDFLKDQKALTTNSAINVNGKLLRNLVIFELNGDNNRNISYEIVEKLIKLWNITKKLNDEKVHPQHLSHLEIRNFNGSDWLYDFVLNHILFQRILVDSGKKYMVILDDSRKLLESVIVSSPFSIFAMPDVKLMNTMFPEPDAKKIEKIVGEVLGDHTRLPFFYEFIVNSWLKFEYNVRFIRDDEDFSRLIKFFIQMLDTFVVQVLEENDLTHLLELPLRFYAKFFDVTEQKDWLNARYEFMRKIGRKSEQSVFIQRQYALFYPLDRILEHLTRIKNTSMIEHTEFDTYIRGLPFANIDKLSQSVEIYRHKLNKLLTN